MSQCFLCCFQFSSLSPQKEFSNSLPEALSSGQEEEGVVLPDYSLMKPRMEEFGGKMIPLYLYKWTETLAGQAGNHRCMTALALWPSPGPVTVPVMVLPYQCAPVPTPCGLTFCCLIGTWQVVRALERSQQSRGTLPPGQVAWGQSALCTGPTQAPWKQGEGRGVHILGLWPLRFVLWEAVVACAHPGA